MTDLQDNLHEIENHARRATSMIRPWIRGMARMGYAAKGVTYVLTGALALLAAFSYADGRTTGSTQAMVSLLEHPYGWVLLVMIAVGLAGYAVWCLVLAVADPDRRGSQWRGLRTRLVHLFKAVGYLGLVGIAAGTLVGIVRSTPHRDPVEQGTARLMSLPLGIWFVAAAGGCVIWAGIFQIYLAWRPERAVDQPDLAGCGAMVRATLLAIGRFGVGARGAIFTLVGLFMVLAAYHANPHEAKDVGRSMRFLQHQWEGRWLLSFMALGFISYGLFQFVLARYRRIEPS